MIGKFYCKKDLEISDIVRLILIWQNIAGESFTDYCSFTGEVEMVFLEFLKDKFPVLYNYHKDSLDTSPFKDTIQYVMFDCEDYLNQWLPEYHDLRERMYITSLYILAEFIMINDKAFEEFSEFFTSEHNNRINKAAIEELEARGLGVNDELLI